MMFRRRQLVFALLLGWGICLDAFSAPSPSITLGLADVDGCHRDDFASAVTKHPMTQILPASINLKADDWKNRDEASQDVDGVCFASMKDVRVWLDALDRSTGNQDVDEETKRSLGNGNVVAVCINTATARAALETGRWVSQDIYYPKGDEDGRDVSKWADMALQAAGDIHERRFWE